MWPAWSEDVKIVDRDREGAMGKKYRSLWAGKNVLLFSNDMEKVLMVLGRRAP